MWIDMSRSSTELFSRFQHRQSDRILRNHSGALALLTPSLQPIRSSFSAAWRLVAGSAGLILYFGDSIGQDWYGARLVA